MIGVMSVSEAIQEAKKHSLDLVEISPNADPAVCKILDFGQYKYESQKKAHDARKKQKVAQIKEIKLRPAIDPHDLGIKIKQIVKFLGAGDKVKITLRFRGREVTHQDIARGILDQIIEETKEIGKVEVAPKLEGRQMMMVLGPLSGK